MLHLSIKLFRKEQEISRSEVLAGPVLDDQLNTNSKIFSATDLWGIRRKRKMIHQRRFAY